MKLMSLRSKKNQKGAAMVEMALILPVLLLLVFGIIEFGWMLRAYQAVGQCAREGVRSAALGADEAAVKARVKDVGERLYNLDASKLDEAIIDVQHANYLVGTSSEYTQYTVTVTYEHPLITGFFEWLNGSNVVSLKQGTAMRLEGEVLEAES